jgi:hypothetical protein
LEKAAETFTYLLMSEKFATLQGRFAAFYGFDKAVFFSEIATYHVLHNLIQIAAVFSSSLRKTGLEVMIKTHFHDLKIRERQSGGNTQ